MGIDCRIEAGKREGNRIRTNNMFHWLDIFFLYEKEAKWSLELHNMYRYFFLALYEKYRNINGDEYYSNHHCGVITINNIILDLIFFSSFLLAHRLKTFKRVKRYRQSLDFANLKPLLRSLIGSLCIMWNLVLTFILISKPRFCPKTALFLSHETLAR